MLKTEHVTASHKTGLETLAELTSAALDSVEKLSELQFQVVRATLDDGSDHGKRVLGAQSLQALAVAQSDAARPSAEKLLAYSRHLYEIAAGAHMEFRKVAQARANEQCRIALAWLDDYAKHAMPGSEVAITLMRSTITATQHACDALQDASTHAISLLDNVVQANGKAQKKSGA
ncbi:phasin family protein [Ralstonia sp. UBA689]|uniref:phasin family protein n=1 Tax=Ralstonia sp. UBA689 TaxID=1947373 RepID=UPI0025CEF58D|nr:phasin family protein [Ralstonia sp. UBA689]